MTLLEKRLELVGLQNPFAGIVPRTEVGDQEKSTVGPRLEFEGWFVDLDPKRNVRLAARPAFAPRAGAFAFAVLLLIGALGVDFIVDPGKKVSLSDFNDRKWRATGMRDITRLMWMLALTVGIPLTAKSDETGGKVDRKTGSV
jgi:hypothetical protein